MKKIIYLLTLFMFSQAHALEEVNFAIGDWSPYTSQSNPKGKLAENIIIESFKQEGVKVNFTYNNWSDSYEQALNGQSDGTFPWYLNEDRAENFLFSDPIFIEKQVFFSLKATNFDWTGYEDLRKYKIAGTKSFTHITTLKSNGIGPIVSDEESESFNKVLNGEVDAYPTSEVVGKQTINTLFSAEDAAKFTTHMIPMTIDNMFLLVSKKVPNGAEIVQTFNLGLMKLKASGRFAEIVEQP